MTPLLHTRALAVPGRLAPVDLRIEPGEFVGLIGPNGAGKTTLIRAALGLIRAEGGSSITDMPLARRPRHLAYLAQDRQLAWPIAVRDLVALGARANPDLRDDGMACADRVLARLGLQDLAHRAVDSLSGGERARVLMGRALAQQAPLLVADEPCAALDPAHSLGMARLMADHARAGGAVLASLHDLPIAARFCTRVLVMRRGQLLADGPPDRVLSPGLMADVFAIAFRRHQLDGDVAWSVGGLD